MACWLPQTRCRSGYCGWARRKGCAAWGSPAWVAARPTHHWQPLLSPATLASQGTRVVAIDLAAHGSCIGALFGLQNGPGFVDLLAGTTDFTKVIIRDPLSSVHHIRWGQQQNAVSLLDQRTDAVLAALKNIYDVVIVHAGEASAQTPQLLGKCEAVILLAPARRHLDVSKAVQALLSMGLLAVQYVRLEPWQSTEAKFAVTA